MQIISKKIEKKRIWRMRVVIKAGFAVCKGMVSGYLFREKMRLLEDILLPLLSELEGSDSSPRKGDDEVRKTMKIKNDKSFNV